MATVQFTETNFVIQAAGVELSWVVSWGLRRDEWFNFQLAPDFSDGQNDETYPSTIEITRQWLTVSNAYPFEVKALFSVKNESPPGSQLVFGFTGLRSQG